MSTEKNKAPKNKRGTAPASLAATVPFRFQPGNPGGAGLKVKLDYSQLRKLCRLNVNTSEIAAFFGVSEDTVQRRMKDDPEVAKIIGLGRANGSISVRRDLFRMSKEGQVGAAIWLSKNICGMREPAQEHVLIERENAVADQILAVVRRTVTDEEYRRILDDMERGGDAASAGDESAPANTAH